MKAKEIMSVNVISVDPSMPAQRVVEILVENNISGVPVLSGEGDLIGIVTEKDLLITYDFVGKSNLMDIKISELMVNDVICFDEEDEVSEICIQMVQKNIKRVPILSNKRVVGIVSRSDILGSILKGSRDG